MSVTYVCRHCHTMLGQINRDDVAEYQLGFHYLTPEERMDIISYRADGDITVKVTCDYCREALEANPELALVANPLQ